MLDQVVTNTPNFYEGRILDESPLLPISAVVTTFTLTQMPVHLSIFLYSLVFGRKNKKLLAASPSRHFHDRSLHV